MSTESVSKVYFTLAGENDEWKWVGRNSDGEIVTESEKTFEYVGDCLQDAMAKFGMTVTYVDPMQDTGPPAPGEGDELPNPEPEMEC